jgi:adenylate kinase family enzyme
MAMAILMFGSPGAGKGKVGDHLVGNPDKPSIIRVESGKIFRKIAEAATQGDPFAARIYCCMQGANGSTLVPDEDTMEVVGKEIHAIPVEWDFIWDAPRSPGQVELFCDIVESRSLDRIITVHLQAPRDVCRERLIGRALKGEVRPDNDPAVIDRRLDEYASYSEQTLAALRRRTRCLDIDATFGELEVAALTFLQLALTTPNQRFKDHIGKLILEGAMAV